MTDLPKIHEIRLINARKVMKESGLDRTQFAEKIGMSYNLLSQYIGKNPKKNIGDDTAKKIEEAFHKPLGFLDQSAEIEIDTNIAKQDGSLSGRWVPVKSLSKMGMDGYFSDMGYDGNGGDGYVPSLTAGKYAYAVKGTGDSMYPVVRNGWFLVCDPDAEPQITEFVEVQLKDGRRTIKEFIGIINGVLHVLAVNGNERITFDMDDVDRIVPVVEIIPPSRHHHEIPLMDQS
ncbi:MAG: LexA family transcriptional regulator [Acinetobacter amyesii]|uniref:LexA family transcriptional regulator n=1 Tax=Acinetobacter amyesii TaxID=2942470 RepID=UPI003D08671D